jgi:hypothetical protein
MATREITISFMPIRNQRVPEWSYERTVPAGLVDPEEVQNTPAYMELFRKEVGAMIPQFQAECDSKAGQNCTNCRGLARTAMLTPCSYLHREDPLINILLHPICGLPQCRDATSLLIEETMRGVDEISSKIKCENCGKGDETNTKRCAKCKMIGCCGRECQKQDWKNHKKNCSRLAEQREAEEQAAAGYQI